MYQALLNEFYKLVILLITELKKKRKASSSSDGKRKKGSKVEIEYEEETNGSSVERVTESNMEFNF